MECLNLVLKTAFFLCACTSIVLISSFLLLHVTKLRKASLKFYLSCCRLLRVNATKTRSLQHHPVYRGWTHSNGPGRNPLCKDFQGEVTTQHHLQKDWETQFHQQAGKRQMPCLICMNHTGPRTSTSSFSAKMSLAPEAPWSFKCRRRQSTPSATSWRKPGSLWTWLCPAHHPRNHATSTSSASAPLQVCEHPDQDSGGLLC